MGPAGVPEFLYARDFPAWFVTRAENLYHWNWQRILFALRDGRFFHSHDSQASEANGIPGGCLTEAEAIRWGEHFIQRLAALATQTTLPTGASVLRSLQLGGFAVAGEKLRLVPLEGPVSAREEEDALARLVQESGIPDIPTVLKHVSDAHFLYLDGKYSSALNESRNLVQALIDAIDNGGGQTWNIFHETAGRNCQSNRVSDRNPFPYGGRKGRSQLCLGKSLRGITSRCALRCSKPFGPPIQSNFTDSFLTCPSLTSISSPCRSRILRLSWERSPSVVTPKPANGGQGKTGQRKRPGTKLFYPAACCGGKSIFVRQLRGPHLST